MQFRIFKFDIFDPDTEPPERLAPLLAKLLATIAHLNKLVLVVPEFHVDAFETAFRDINLIFPEVTTVVVGPYCDFVLPMVPNVSTVATNGWQWLHSKRAVSLQHREHTTRIVAAAAKLKALKRFESMEWWTDSQVKGTEAFVFRFHFPFSKTMIDTRLTTNS
jgi:hypothetical protein